jgi:hypothetical protein
MAKTFRDLVEALKKREEAEEEKYAYGNVGGPPRSEGEAAFADAHGYPVKVRGKGDKAYPTAGTDDVLNGNRSMSKDDHNLPSHNRGEKEVVYQATSKLPKNDMGFGDKRTDTAANKSEVKGDTKPVILSVSAVRPMSESMTTQLTRISGSKSPGVVNFADGDSAQVSPKLASQMLSKMKSMGPSASDFAKDLETPSGFMKMMNVVGDKS